MERVIYNEEKDREMGSKENASTKRIERQGRLEKTDFDGINTKLRGVEVSDELQTLFNMLIHNPQDKV